jgi:hypothetical protein
VLDRLRLSNGGYMLVSAHREENDDALAWLPALLDCPVAVCEAFRLPVLVSGAPSHPRTAGGTATVAGA